MTITIQPIRAYLFIFLALFLINLSSNSHARVAEDAVIQDEASEPKNTDLFSYSIGETFDKNEALEEALLASGETAYKVEYKGAAEGQLLENYFVTLNSDNTINSIRGNKLFNSLEDAKNAIDAIESSNSKDFGSPVIEDEFRYYKDSGDNVSIAFIRVIGNQYELHLHCLSSDK